MLIDLTRPAQLSVEEVGGKAYNLHRLIQMNMPVPAAIVVPAYAHNYHLNDKLFRQLFEQIMAHEIVMTGAKFAVRSSGIGEDGQEHSFAGIFDSFLDVPKEDLAMAIIKVWDSAESPRSAMYVKEKGAVIQSMGVVIQHMLNPQYAGVAFTVCPIEKDQRVALLEVVRGSGDSLVSGKKTPATVRINKITGMARIARNGVDEIANLALEEIASSLLPFIEKIESEYGVPVDIEWAIANGKVYILQTRPITT